MGMEEGKGALGMSEAMILGGNFSYGVRGRDAGVPAGRGNLDHRIEVAFFSDAGCSDNSPVSLPKSS